MSLAVVAAVLTFAIVLAGPSIGSISVLVQASPSGSTSPSATQTSSPSPSSTTTPAPREVSLIASNGTVTWGNDVLLSGQVLSTDPECEGQEAVYIRRRFVDAPRFRVLVTAHTDSEGGFETRQEVNRSAKYKATLFRADECEGAASELVTVFVRVKVTVSVSDNPIQQGNFFTVSGEVKPSHRGTKVILDRKSSTGWRKVDGVTVGRGSRYSFTLVAGWEGERTFRVRWPSQDHDHKANKSRVLTINSV